MTERPPRGVFCYRGGLYVRRTGWLRAGQVPRCPDGHKMPAPITLHAGRGWYCCRHHTSRSETGTCAALLYRIADADERVETRAHVAPTEPPRLVPLVWVADLSADDAREIESEHAGLIRTLAVLAMENHNFPDAPAIPWRAGSPN